MCFLHGQVDSYHSATKEVLLHNISILSHLVNTAFKWVIHTKVFKIWSVHTGVLSLSPDLVPRQLQSRGPTCSAKSCPTL